MECWICLAGEDNSSENGSGGGGAAGSLESSFCLCPSSVRPVHPRCLGRWQIQKAGTREETHCRFCNSAYQLDWRTSLSRPDITANSNTTSNSQGGAAAPAAAVQPNQPGPSPRRLRPPTPIMAIIFEGQVHRIKVYPGPEGKARFQQQIRELVQLRDDEEFEVEFECKAPDSGAVLHLDGMDAFDAATHCASLTAAERLTRQKQSRNRSSSSRSNGSATTSEQPTSDQQQEQDPEQQQRRTRRSLRHGASADVQLQVAAQHGPAAGSCPSRRGAANN